MSNGEVTRNTKAALRKEARRLFARHGYEGVSMRDIAQAVGIQQSAIYNHFQSKQTLLVDLMVRHMERVIADLSAKLAGIPSPGAQLEAFARFHVTDHIDHAEDVFLAYMEIRSLEAHGRASVMGLRQKYEDVLRDILSEGKASAHFQFGDAAVTARALLAMWTGVTVWFCDDGRLSRNDVAETYVQASLQSVGLNYEQRTVR
ncbi:MAG: TetR/AcrR family transcriptional regulator [Pseudomonadota bacterium]